MCCGGTDPARGDGPAAGGVGVYEFNLFSGRLTMEDTGEQHNKPKKKKTNANKPRPNQIQVNPNQTKPDPKPKQQNP